MFKNAMLSVTATLGLAVSASAQQTIFDPATGRWVAHSATRVDSVDAFGRVNTSGTTVHSSATAPYRESSKYNGSMRRVNRPKFDAYGNLVGYEVGVEWTNSVTGETHGDTKVVTNNGLNVNNVVPSYPPAYPPAFPPNGGLNDQHVIRSAPVGGLNVQGNVYGPPGGSNVQHIQAAPVFGGRHAQHHIRSAPAGGGVNVQSNVHGGGRPQTMGGAPTPFNKSAGGGSMPAPPRMTGVPSGTGGFRAGVTGPRR